MSTASEAVKAAGLKNLEEMVDISSVNRQTLNNWFKNKPTAFRVMLAGCVAIKQAEQTNGSVG